ncbi:MAG TPA: hypothetical protein VEQ62_05965 [Stellaceae bacterium]|jgi:hypothetical protein|nr:hypothetical protein [Stellaceae bacterium]
MALTYVFLVIPASANAVSAAGVSYTPNAAGIITGVTPADAQSLQGVNAEVRLVGASGATTDRPATQPATALTGAINNLAPFPRLALPFHDSTLAKEVYFVGNQRSSTGWVDITGTAA